jgi:hypothetical protein
MNVLYPISAFAGKFCIQWDFDGRERKQDGYEEDFRGEKELGKAVSKKSAGEDRKHFGEYEPVMTV